MLNFDSTSFFNPKQSIYKSLRIIYEELVVHTAERMEILKSKSTKWEFPCLTASADAVECAICVRKRGTRFNQIILLTCARSATFYCFASVCIGI